MHTYERPTTCPDPFPSMAEFRFADALDVVAYAEIDLCIGRMTWPETWHLDDAGVMQCAVKGSSCDTLIGWAYDPSHLLRSRRTGRDEDGGCTERWVIVDSRLSGFRDPPDEADAWAFLELRGHLQSVGVELLDAVVFDSEGHWWSMHELTSGTTAWTPPPRVRATARRERASRPRAQ